MPRSHTPQHPPAAQAVGMQAVLSLTQTTAIPCPVTLHLARDATNTRRLREGDYHRVRPGVYVATPAWTSLAPWDRYLTRVHAAARRMPDAVFSHESAAALCGLPLFGEPHLIHLIEEGSHSHRTGDVLIHASQSARFVALQDGLFTTDLGDIALDLGRTLPPAQALAVIDAILRRTDGAESLAHLRRRSAASPNRRGTRQLAWLWSRADARAESVGESVSRIVIEWLGFPHPDLQREFRSDGHDDRVDLYWERESIIGEFDGEQKYRGDDDALLAEKRREDRLRRRCRGFVRWGWPELMSPDRLADRLLAAGLVRVRPPDLDALATLRRNSRTWDRAARRHERSADGATMRAGHRG